VKQSGANSSMIDADAWKILERSKKKIIFHDCGLIEVIEKL